MTSKRLKQYREGKTQVPLRKSFWHREVIQRYLCHQKQGRDGLGLSIVLVAAEIQSIDPTDIYKRISRLLMKKK